MVWNSVNDSTPCESSLGGKQILVLVNGEIHLCTVLSWNGDFLSSYPVYNNFLYCPKQGWCGDRRFAKPTHWMAIPDPPSSENSA